MLPLKSYQVQLKFEGKAIRNCVVIFFVLVHNYGSFICINMFSCELRAPKNRLLHACDEFYRCIRDQQRRKHQNASNAPIKGVSHSTLRRHWFWYVSITTGTYSGGAGDAPPKIDTYRNRCRWRPQLRVLCPRGVVRHEVVTLATHFSCFTFWSFFYLVSVNVTHNKKSSLISRHRSNFPQENQTRWVTSINSWSNCEVWQQEG